VPKRYMQRNAAPPRAVSPHPASPVMSPQVGDRPPSPSQGWDEDGTTPPRDESPAQPRSTQGPRRGTMRWGAGGDPLETRARVGSARHRYQAPSRVGRMSEVSVGMAAAWLPDNPSPEAERLNSPMDRVARSFVSQEVPGAALSAPAGAMPGVSGMRQSLRPVSSQSMYRSGRGLSASGKRGQQQRRPSSSMGLGATAEGAAGRPMLPGQPPPPLQEPPPPPPTMPSSEMPFPSRVPMAYVGWGFKSPTFYEHRGPASFAGLESIRAAIKANNAVGRQGRPRTSGDASNGSRNNSQRGGYDEIRQLNPGARRRGSARASNRESAEVIPVNAAAWCRQGFNSNQPFSMYGPLV